MLCLKIRHAIRKMAKSEKVSTRLILEAFADIQSVNPKPQVEVMETTPCMRAVQAARQIAHDFQDQEWSTS